MATPLDTVNQLTRAINSGDLATAVQLYEPDAILVVRPGQVARGWAQLHEALAGFVALRATLTSEAQHVLEAGDLAPVVLGGESTDILRRQNDGRWLIAIDDPWGAQPLGPS
jgi:ketosteroid isomerase-like protein